MENMGLNPEFWRNKNVLVTGHTGFKGGWLSLWLSELGAKVHGFSLKPPTSPSFYEIVDIGKVLDSEKISDLRNFTELETYVTKIQPEIVFHLAAQPLVSRAFVNPLETMEVNILGLGKLYETLRTIKTLRAVVNITSDKCYENKEWEWSYREIDTLGGNDIYSASKACSEIIHRAFVKSFFDGGKVNFATVRAGNVIGGGDWGENRLLPDIVRHLFDNRPLTIRNPNSHRPWQYVLEPLVGYLILGHSLYVKGDAFAGAWNFGPQNNQSKTVSWILEYSKKRFSDLTFENQKFSEFKESQALKVDSSKAMSKLNWAPKFGINRAIDYSLDWYEKYYHGENMLSHSINQLENYQSLKNAP